MNLDTQQRAALRAIQDMSVAARKMADDQMPHEQLAKFLDDVDGLFGLLLSTKDIEQGFEPYLRSMCDDYGLEFYWTLYRSRLAES